MADDKTALRDAEKRFISKKGKEIFTLQNLMDEFGYSRSTARREILALQGDPHYIPIIPVRGRGGGYRVDYNWTADKEWFSPEEDVSLRKAEYILNKSYEGTLTEDDLKSITVEDLENMEQILKKHGRSQVTT